MIHFFYIVPFKDTRRLFTITDLNNNPVLYERPKELSKPYYFEQFNLCFTGSSDAVKNMKVYDIPSIFTKPYIIFKSNCPLFAWLPYNNNTYQALIRLGMLEDKPYESAHPAIHGYNVLSYVMRNHFIFSEDFMNRVNRRKKNLQDGNCISFHMRMGDKKSDFKETRAFIYENDLLSFIKCPVVNENVDVPIFVSSDSSYAKEIIMNNTKNHRVVTYHKKAIHSGGFSFGKGLNSTINTFLDLVTLGSCKEFVGTYASTFSILAASFTGKLPYFVTRNSSCFKPTDYFYLL